MSTSETIEGVLSLRETLQRALPVPDAASSAELRSAEAGTGAGACGAASSTTALKQAVVQHAGSLNRASVNDMIKAACQLTHKLRTVREEDRESDRVVMAKGVLQRCQELLFYLEQAVCTLDITVRVRGQLHSNAPPRVLINHPDEQQQNDMALIPGVARFAGMDGEDKTSPIQELILYMLDVVYSKGYSRYGQDCYERLLTSQGYDTRAWKRVCSIKELIYDATRKEIKKDQWLNLTHNRSNAQTVVDYMVQCSDSQFPVITKNRNVFSFKNGIYLTTTRAALGIDIEVDRCENAEERRRTLCDAFLPYGSQAYADLPPEVFACNYFDSFFPGEMCTDAYGRRDGDWYHDIPTPYLQSVFDYQAFDEDVCRWVYVFIGRLLYELNDYDSWQVIPYLMGQASSGKSTIVNMCRSMFELCDVGVLSNNVERKFGIASFSDKYLFIAPEIKSDLQLEQAEFQSMVSGEPLQLAVKFQQAHTVDWKVPGILAGNEIPGWVDNSGSIGRRIVVFEFVRKVVDGDVELKHKLRREMPNIILKCNRAYHWAVKKCGADYIWNHLPEYFKRTRDNVAKDMDPLKDFLDSGRLVFDKDAYMPLEKLKLMFQQYCSENAIKKTRLTKGKLIPAMYERGMIFEDNKDKGITRAYPRPAVTNTDGNVDHTNLHYETHREWCIGVDAAAPSVSSYCPPQGADTGIAFGGGSGGNVFDDPMLGMLM